MRIATTALAACLALTLSACNKADDGAVAATVNGQKITAAQLDTELKAANLTNVQNPELRRVALQRMVARKVLAEYSRAQKLDQTPDARILEAATVENFKAQLAQRDLIAKVKPPTADEARAYVQAHPEMFADRKLYLLEQAALAQAPDKALEDALKPAVTFDDVVKVLNARGVPFKRSVAQMDPLRADPAVVKIVTSAPGNVAFVLPLPPGLAIAHVRAFKAEPVPAAQAEGLATQLLAAQASQKAIADKVDALMREPAGKITYGKGYAPATPGG